MNPEPLLCPKCQCKLLQAGKADAVEKEVYWRCFVNECFVNLAPPPRFFCLLFNALQSPGMSMDFDRDRSGWYRDPANFHIGGRVRGGYLLWPWQLAKFACNEF